MAVCHRACSWVLTLSYPACLSACARFLRFLHSSSLISRLGPDVYLYPRVDSVVHIDLFVDGQSIRVPRSRDVNPKNAHLANFVLCDEEQHALFQLVSRAKYGGAAAAARLVGSVFGN